MLFDDISDGRVATGVVVAASRAVEFMRVCDISISEKILPASLQWKLEGECGFEGGEIIVGEHALRRFEVAMRRSRNWHRVIAAFIGKRQRVFAAIDALSHAVEIAIVRKWVLALTYLEKAPEE